MDYEKLRREIEKGVKVERGGVEYNIVDVGTVKRLPIKRLTIEDRKKFMGEMSEEDKTKRHLLAQMYSLYRKAFPKEERQTLEDFRSEYEQKLLPREHRKKEIDFDLLTLYEGKELKGFVSADTSAKGKRNVTLVGYVAVDPKERGKGLSKELYKMLIKVAKSRGSNYLVGEREQYGQKERERLQYLGGKKEMLTEEEELERKNLTARKTRSVALRQYYALVEDFPYLQPPMGESKETMRMDLYLGKISGKKGGKISRDEVLEVARTIYEQIYGLNGKKADKLLQEIKREIGDKKYFNMIPAEKIEY